MRGDYPRADHRECRMKEISGICRCAPALYPNLATPEAGRQRGNENDVNARKKTASFDAVFKNKREEVSACAAARLLGQLAEKRPRWPKPNSKAVSVMFAPGCVSRRSRAASSRMLRSRSIGATP